MPRKSFDGREYKANPEKSNWKSVCVPQNEEIEIDIEICLESALTSVQY